MLGIPDGSSCKVVFARKGNRNMNAGDNDKWDIYQDKADEWRWRRTAPNGNIVGASTEGYKNRSDCEDNARRNGWSDD